MIKMFFSYSHADESYRDDLEKHLSVLKRERIIKTWHDRRIVPGSDLSSAIDENLLDSDIILLLVSPDFLASDYCYTQEMKIALEKHEKSEARVIPIILDHCDWKNTTLKKLLALPPDGKPITEYPSRNKALNEITLGIRQTIHDMGGSTTDILESANIITRKKTTNVAPNLRSSNLRIKREFSDYDKDKYQKGAFEYMVTFFQNSLVELETRSSDIQYNFTRTESNKFIAVIYRNGKSIASCTVSNQVEDHFFSGITYSYGTNASGYNALLEVGNNGYSMFLRQQIMIHESESELSYEGAAELYWAMLIEQLQ